MSWRDKITKALLGKPVAPPAAPAMPRFPPDLAPVAPNDPRVISRMQLDIMEGGLPVGGMPPRGQPSISQMNINRPPADVLPFDERWPR